MRKRNLMSAKQNLLMRAYREHPETVREILEITRHESATPSRNRVKDYILCETGTGANLDVVKSLSLSLPLTFLGVLIGWYCASPIEKLIGSGIACSSMGIVLKKAYDLATISDEYQQLKKNSARTQKERGDNQLEFLFEN